MEQVVYLIKDPETMNVVYVGRTKDFDKRKQEHCSRSAATKVSKYIQRLKERGLTPIFEVKEKGRTEDMAQLEIDTIKSYSQQLELLNSQYSESTKPAPICDHFQEITQESLKTLDIGQTIKAVIKDGKHLQRIRNYAHNLKPDYLFKVYNRSGVIEVRRLMNDTPSLTGRINNMEPGDIIHIYSPDKLNSIRVTAAMLPGKYNIRIAIEVEKIK